MIKKKLAERRQANQKSQLDTAAVEAVRARLEDLDQMPLSELTEAELGLE